MRKKYSYLRILLAALAVLPLAARAQSEFRPGYIVPAAGDTVRGEIDLRDHYFNNTKCRFRASAAAEVRTYRPDELRAYGVPAEGQQFRRIVPLPGPAAYFGQLLVSGPASLYLLRDADRADHFYLDAPDFALAELVTIQTPVPGQPTRVREDARYRLTLQQAMPNCPAAEAMLPHLPFREDALRRVVTAFNACRGVVAAAQPLRVRQRPQVGVLGGGQLTNATFRYQNGFNGNQTLDYGTSSSYALGLSAELPLTALSRRLTLAAALLVAQQHHEVVQTSGAAAGRYTLSATYLRLPLLVRYTAPNGIIRPFVELGPTLALALSLRNQMGGLATNAPEPEDFYPDTQRTFEEGVAAGIGVRFPYAGGRSASLGVRTELDTGWIEALGYTSRITRVFALLAFNLTK